MKVSRVVMVAVVLFATPYVGQASSSKEEINSCIDTLEIYEGSPDRSYSIIAPVRAKKGKGIVGLVSGKSAIDRVLDSIKKDACKKGADAIVNLVCGEAIKGHGAFYGDKDGAYGDSHIDTVPACSGMAVRWTM